MTGTHDTRAAAASPRTSRRSPVSARAATGAAVVLLALGAAPSALDRQQARLGAEASRAAETLRAVWTAERLHRTLHGGHAPSIAALVDAGLLAPERPDPAAGMHTSCEVVRADPERFEAVAFVMDADRVLAQLVIDQTGAIEGTVWATGEPILAAPALLRSHAAPGSAP